MPEKRTELEGIDGWLVIYLFSLFMILFGLLGCVYDAIDEELHTVFILIPLVLFFLDILLLYLYWQKKRIFRTLAIIFQSLMIFDAVIAITYSILSSQIYKIGPICIQLSLGVIWLIYVIRSKRIDYTYVDRTL